MKKPFKATLYACCLLATAFLYSFITKPGNMAALTVAKTTAGTVAGLANSTGDVAAFKGIPFAAPPVGELRWKAPQPVKPWTEVKKCVAFAPSPLQAKPVIQRAYTAEFLIPEPISEDCLYLNVWTNATSKAAKKPVVVWIYGGGFGAGGSAIKIYDGEALAKKGVVFVSINYRVGALGFMAHPDLSKESPGKVSGNYGLLDQIAGLKWVQQNIASFGGDPQQVTIAGQSAGAMSVSMLVASPLAKGLFQRAIAESGSLLTPNPIFKPVPLAKAEIRGTRVAEGAGAKSLAELRQLSADDIVKKFLGFYPPVIDGYLLPEPVGDLYEHNKQAHVPLLTGWNADEGASAGLTAAEYQKKAAEDYGPDAAEFLKWYPGATDAQALHSQADFVRNQVFALSGYKWARTQSQYANSPVYVYNFDRKVPAPAELVQYGAFHTAEVAYALGNLRFLVSRPLEPADNTLSALMADYWVNFIKTGNPNAAGLPAWPAYTTKDNLVKVFDATTKTAPMPGQGALDFMLARPAK